jgi:hypothetical protein
MLPFRVTICSKALEVIVFRDFVNTHPRVTIICKSEKGDSGQEEAFWLPREIPPDISLRAGVTDQIGKEISAPVDAPELAHPSVWGCLIKEGVLERALKTGWQAVLRHVPSARGEVYEVSMCSGRAEQDECE